MKKTVISRIRLYFSILIFIGILPLTGCTDRHLLSSTKINIGDLSIEIGQGKHIRISWDKAGRWQHSILRTGSVFYL